MPLNRPTTEVLVVRGRKPGSRGPAPGPSDERPHTDIRSRRNELSASPPDLFGRSSPRRLRWLMTSPFFSESASSPVSYDGGGGSIPRRSPPSQLARQCRRHKRQPDQPQGAVRNSRLIADGAARRLGSYPRGRRSGGPAGRKDCRSYRAERGLASARCAGPAAPSLPREA